MKTEFSLAALANDRMAATNEILRNCVHCGFCNATCPTFSIAANELDGPRGRIYLVKEMFEKERAPDHQTVKRIDRCLSCLSCMTTCPSGVDYMHLVDHARAHIEKTYVRPWRDRFIRGALAVILPRPAAFRLVMTFAYFAKPALKIIPGVLGEVGSQIPPIAKLLFPARRRTTYQAAGTARMRVGLLAGCVQDVLRDAINSATIRLLNRYGVDVVIVPEFGCCGALSQHLGKEDAFLQFARKNIKAWKRAQESLGLKHFIVNASGCGTVLKDYGHVFENDPIIGPLAREFSQRVLDISELLAELPVSRTRSVSHVKVAYHSACSIQHGQRLKDKPADQLARCGFEISQIPDGHLCCGSAGTYNILQPEFANELLKRKMANIEKTKCDVIAGGNIGCIMQLKKKTDVPVLHTAELIDWATGGPCPFELRRLAYKFEV